MINLALVDISKHLTEEVINKAFQTRTGSQDTVKCIEVSRAAAAGEGLLSAVYRVQVTGHQHSASFVVKGLIADPLLRKTLDSNKFFKREVEFFTTVLPVISEVQPTLGAKERISLYLPICYGSYHDGIDDYILLEDLSESDCRSVSETPSNEEKNRVLKTLAHFHAVSMALRIKSPEKFNEIANSLPELYFNETNRDWYSTYLRNAIDVDRKVMAEFEEADSVYYKKFNEVLSQDLYGQYIATVTTRGKHPVLCHGDSWAPNFLCSRDRMVMIDFQIVRCTSLATDLAYWIMMCSNHTTVKQDFLDAVDMYYSALAYYLQDMGLDTSKVFSRATLDQELKVYGKFGFLASLTSLPLMTSENCDGSVSIADKFPGVEKVPLERLWNITPIANQQDKLRLRNAVRVAVDVGLI